jgi:hypothetical protein
MNFRHIVFIFTAWTHTFSHFSPHGFSSSSHKRVGGILCASCQKRADFLPFRFVKHLRAPGVSLMKDGSVVVVAAVIGMMDGAAHGGGFDASLPGIFITPHMVQALARSIFHVVVKDDPVDVAAVDNLVLPDKSQAIDCAGEPDMPRLTDAYGHSTFFAMSIHMPVKGDGSIVKTGRAMCTLVSDGEPFGRVIANTVRSHDDQLDWLSRNRDDSATLSCVVADSSKHASVRKLRPFAEKSHSILNANIGCMSGTGGNSMFRAIHSGNGPRARPYGCQLGVGRSCSVRVGSRAGQNRSHIDHCQGINEWRARYPDFLFRSTPAHYSCICLRPDE